jgi:hypothetical protein
MRMLKHRVSAVVCAAALSMIFSRTGAAQMAREPEIQLETQAMYHSRTLVPPPAARTEAKPAVSSAGVAWVPGFWNLEGDPMTAPHGGWVWVPGRLETPPMPGAHWDQAHWGWDADTKTDRWWTWIPGHWDEPGRGK